MSELHENLAPAPYVLAAMNNGSGLKAEEVCDSIFLIRDVLSSDELNALYRFLDKTSEDDWIAGSLLVQAGKARELYGSDVSDEVISIYQSEQSYTYWSDKVVNTPFKEFGSYTSKLRGRLSPFFTGPFTFSDFGIINRQYPGVGLTHHKDQNVDLTLAGAALLYLNDDYEGGELDFSNLGFSIKPPAGSVLTFPSTEKWTHGVLPVTGTKSRYAMPGLVWSA